MKSVYGNAKRMWLLCLIRLRSLQINMERNYLNVCKPRLWVPTGDVPGQIVRYTGPSV
jgi:hypothetical protein